VDVERLHTGEVELDVTGADLDAFFASGSIPLSDGFTPEPNTCVTLRSTDGHPRTGLARYDAGRQVVSGVIGN
jgi:hypothetical protein